MTINDSNNSRENTQGRDAKVTIELGNLSNSSFWSNNEPLKTECGSGTGSGSGSGSGTGSGSGSGGTGL